MRVRIAVRGFVLDLASIRAERERERERECLKLSHPHKALNTESGPSCLDEEERVSGVRHLNRGLQCCAIGAGCPGQEYR